MRIRSSIFFWVFFATIVPLTVLALTATYFTEYSYQRDVTRTVNTSLDSLASEMRRYLENNADLALGMSQAPAVSNMLPLLAAIKKGETLPDINIRRSRINHFFEGFQTIIQGNFFLRILDINGNTLIKVGQKQRSPAVYESLSGINYVEQEVGDTDFIQQLQSLPRDEVTTLRLPHNQQNDDLVFNFPLMDYLVPLYYNNQQVGALGVTLVGEHIDRVLDHAPDIYGGNIFLTESNVDLPERHGLILYEKKNNLRLAQVRPNGVYVQDIYGKEVLENAINASEGKYQTDNNLYTHYFVELLPYHNKLVSWILTSRIESSVISAPFNQIRAWIWSIAGAALVISLLLTDIGARIIAKPIRRLATNLKAYADGDHKQRVKTDEAIDEISSLAEAFNYMADTLDDAQLERDHAQHMMLQSSKLASIGEMAAGIGHEINNPLNNILSYTKLISRSVANNSDKLESKDLSRLQSDLDSLRDEALRASDIIRGILNFARQVPPEYSSFSIDTWLKNTIALVQQTARSKHVELKLDNRCHAELQGDRGQLQQALINLLLNAIQASPENDEVLVTAVIDEDRFILKIIDHGAGINESEMDRIFDPFFTTKPEGEGSGLGLSISLGIIEHHHGTLVLTNNDDRGTTASIILPMTPELYK
ncbi:MAG: HAMP domain-containing sensor histidine kinase [Gammaproteobacteria bacterium]